MDPLAPQTLRQKLIEFDLLEGVAKNKTNKKRVYI
jgi:hypothetical protein